MLNMLKIKTLLQNCLFDNICWFFNVISFINHSLYSSTFNQMDSKNSAITKGKQNCKFVSLLIKSYLVTLKQRYFNKLYI